MEKFHAEVAEMWRARRVPELFAFHLDLSLSAPSTTQRPLRATLKRDRIKPNPSIRELQRRHRKFHAEVAEMWRARRVPELFVAHLDLSLSAPSTTQRPLRATLKRDRIKPNPSIRELQRRHRKFHAEGAEMRRARRVPELFVSLHDLIPSAPSTTPRPLRETLKGDRVKLQSPIRILHSRHRKFHNIEDIERHFQSLVPGGDAAEINIRRQVPLPVTFYIGPVKRDVAVLVLSQVLIGPEHAFCTGADGNIQPARDRAFGKEGAEVGAEPVGLTVIILEKTLRRAAAEQFFTLTPQLRIVVCLAVKREFHLNALFIPGQFLGHEQAAAEEIGTKIRPAPSPFRTESIQHFDHRLVKGPAHAAEPDPFFAVDACPPPELHAGLAFGIGAVGMADLVHLVPFFEVIERMKIALRVIPVPGGIEADHGDAVTDDVGAGNDAGAVFNLVPG